MGALPAGSGRRAELGVKGRLLDGRLAATAAMYRMTDSSRALTATRSNSCWLPRSAMLTLRASFRG